LSGKADQARSEAMSRPLPETPPVTPDMLLKAYACGIFPMAESAEDPTLYWIEPDARGILPLERFHLPRRLARTIRADRFDIRIDTDFDAVIDGCAAPAPGRRKTWINAPIRELYRSLFGRGACHTVEAWREGELVGGLYGVSLGAAFFGESMFHTQTDASKVALAHLVARLRVGGYRLLDTQFVTSHLGGFGAIEVSRRSYQKLLADALPHRADFTAFARGRMPSGREVLEILEPGG
jgi:leucyl/phenylalanyl-tRNA--protein transferase